MKSTVNASFVGKMKKWPLHMCMFIAQYFPTVYSIPILPSPAIEPFVLHSRIHIGLSICNKSTADRIGRIKLFHLPLMVFKYAHVPGLYVQISQYIRGVQSFIL